MRTATGNKPQDGQFTATVVLDGHEWELYERPSSPDYPGVVALKLITGARKGGANFWLTYIPALGRLWRRHDALRLWRQAPEVSAWVELAMSDPDAAQLIYGGDYYHAN